EDIIASVREEADEEAAISVATQRPTDSRDIVLDSVSIAYGTHVLLKDASVRFVYGKRYGLIGENGVGKSTLLRHVNNGTFPLPKDLSVLYVSQ
ncbi:hypothetical protein KIPB_013910, partial [Kipferlia bialata]